MNLFLPTKPKKPAYEKDLDLEILTKRFVVGELSLDEYRKKVAELELDTRLDLRRISSRLKPILDPVNIQDRKRI